MRDYKQTLHLPQTAFAMRASLAQKEPRLLAGWKEQKLGARILESRSKAPRFLLHDGPPYANGKLHHGHILNKILKDIVIKDRTLAGFCVPYVPGWDCHGLPIETQVDKGLGKKKQAMSKAEFRRACRAYAQSFVQTQSDSFERLGVFGRFERPYRTMDYGYEAQTLRELARLVRSGLVYKGLRPVNWCLSHRTALAEAEVEYEDHSSPSVYVAFALVGRDLPAPLRAGCDLLIWTTTPWTLPANQAIALHEDFFYVAYPVRGRLRLVEETLLAGVLQACNAGPFDATRVAWRGPGKQLIGAAYDHAFLPRQAPVLHGPHVTREAGTGCVHIATAHGADDFALGAAHGIAPQTPVLHDGTLSEAAGPFAGGRVFAVNEAIIAHLAASGALLSEPTAKLRHRYPHCWRCHQPIIIRATEQWFAAMDKPFAGGGSLRQRVLEAITDVQWVPGWGHSRIGGMFQTRPDWCLSRQRAWGVPLAVVYCGRCQAPKLDATLIERVADKVEAHGADIWFEASVQDLCGPLQCACGHTEFVKEQDILDVWFDSGVSYAAVVEREHLGHAQGPPIDLVLEGSDQHRGWFHAGLLCSLSTRHRAPFRAVFTHGFVVDGAGKKLSKSQGNFIDPERTIAQDGAELLRLWVASEDVRDDVRLSPEILRRISESYRKVRNTLRFLLGNLADFDPERDMVDPAKLQPLDVYALAQAACTFDKVRVAFAAYAFHAATAALLELCTVDLSAFYLDILKDRLYAGAKGAVPRRAAQSALYVLARDLIVHLSPILCFTGEEAKHHLPKLGDDVASVHLSYYPDHPKALAPAPLRAIRTYVQAHGAAMVEKFAPLLALRKQVNHALERARGDGLIGASIQAKVQVTLPRDAASSLCDGSFEARFWADFFIVSQAEVVAGQGKLDIEVSVAPGQKCGRCWLLRTDIGQHAAHPSLCGRCVEALGDAT